MGRRTFTKLIVIALVLAALASCAPDPTPTPIPLPTDDLIPTPPRAADFDLATRYRGVSPTPLSNDTLYRNESLGTETSFWVLDLDFPKMREVHATLEHVSDAALWYVADSIAISPSNLASAASAFDSRILPEVQRIFAPGLELPGKITILNASIPGLAGYFSSSDTLPTDASRFSNERLMVVMHGDDAGSNRFEGTLAHELQHLVQWHVDPSEETWVSEGLAEFAAGILNLPRLPRDSYFNHPSVSFSNWPAMPDQSIPAYAAAGLFFDYLHDKLGLAGIQQVISEPADGVAGMSEVFADEGVDFTSFFANWLVANIVRATTGPYAYEPPTGSVRVNQSIVTPSVVDASAPQLGGYYLRIDPGDASFNVRFDGTPTTPLLPVAPHSGDRCWWSNRGDSIDSTLTRSFDLRGIDDPTLRFWTWYAIEDGFDHAYVAVSTDDGSSWRTLAGDHTTDDDPIGVSFGSSFTGEGGGWVEEQMGLSPYKDSTILLRFNYVTDESINGAGWCIDDITINEARFTDDAESDAGWQAEGFVRIQRDGIPQRFELRTIAGTGDNAIVTPIALDANNNASFVVDELVTLIVAGLTHQTTQPGQFTITTTR